MTRSLRRLPWLTFQMIAANVAIILMLGTVWYWLFMRQSTAYSDRLMTTFNIEPGQLHTMFVEEVERQLWTSITVGLVCAVLASIGLTLLIIRPLRAFAGATDLLRRGDYSVRAQNRSGELGNLADTINALAAALEQEEDRRARYLADLGHELRTPITSLRGHIEGLEDGVFTADDSFFSLLSEELSHLTALTHSIELLELDANESDDASGPAAFADVFDDIKRRWDTHFRTKHLDLCFEADDALRDRTFAASQKSLRHIIDNLMSNMLRYAEGSQRCRVAFTLQRPRRIRMIFCNGAKDLAAEDVPFLFDRFFRASHSRTRARKEHPSGLGLSIVRQICLSNGGQVDASLEDERLCIVVQLPLNGKP